MSPEQIRYHFPKHIADEAIREHEEQQFSAYREAMRYAYTSGAKWSAGKDLEGASADFEKWFDGLPHVQELKRRGRNSP